MRTRDSNCMWFDRVLLDDTELSELEMQRFLHHADSCAHHRARISAAEEWVRGQLPSSGSQDDGEMRRARFGALMRLMRLGNKRTTAALASDMRVPEDEIVRLECGEQVAPRTLAAAARYYSIPSMRMQQLAGVRQGLPGNLEYEASRFAAHAERFDRLTRHERRLLDAFMKALREPDSE